MIPPNLLSADLFFYAVPIWQWEPVEPPAGDGCEPPSAGAEAAAAAASELAAAEPTNAAAAAALRLVFKGYEWRSGVDWSCIAVSEWEHWTDSKRDDAAADARSRERVRNGTAVPPAIAPAADAAQGDSGAADSAD